MPSDGQTLLLPDGRTLGYAEYGSPNGTPLLYFHGFPMSRLEAYGLDGIASRRNIRLLSIDRPGFGLSTNDPNRRIIDWPADVQAFAAELGLSQFAILGPSGGGPYVLACAKQLPRNMLTAVGVLSGAPVWDRGFWTSGVLWYARFFYLAAKYWPSALIVISAALVAVLRFMISTRHIERMMDKILETIAKAKVAKEKKNDTKIGLDKMPWTSLAMKEREDQEQLVPSIVQRRKRFVRVLFGGFAQGTSGFVHETRLLTRDWGFKFEDVTYKKVQMWHGSKDANAPIGSIRNMAKRMPHCVLKEYDETHYSMADRLEEVLDDLIPGSRDDTDHRYRR